ncbi:MAG: hypothetical protein IC227_03650 [Enterococcus lacertideformus]|uniref:Uncharacterized protein n=1 Tax=Enterococcus lacertideformus TaxID=2771493 RepID=A0A931AXP4_9ENTE|nr:hypothetical protein [Enterococcus lacertideformus]
MLNPLVAYKLGSEGIIIHNKFNASDIYFRLNISLEKFQRLVSVGQIFETVNDIENYLLKVDQNQMGIMVLMKIIHGEVKYISPNFFKDFDLEDVKEKLDKGNLDSVPILSSSFTHFTKENFFNAQIDYYTDFHTCLAYNWDREIYLDSGNLSVSERIVF